MNDQAGRPLAELSVLVTRPKGREQGLLDKVRAVGAQACHLPCLAIEPIALGENAALRPSYDWLIFISVNAVQHFGPRENWPAGRVAAIGASTARAIANMGNGPDLLPSKGYTSEDLLAEEAMRAPAGEHILIIRGEGGRETLANTLRSRGARVDHVAVYRRLAPRLDATPIIEPWLRAKHPILTISSGETLDNFMNMIDAPTTSRLRHVRLIAPSQRVAKQASKLDCFASVHAASDPTDEAMFATIQRIAAAN